MIGEIILFDRPSSSPEELMQMGVDQSAAEFMFIPSKVDQVTQFAYDLSLRHIRDDEMPENVINVSRVNYLIGQILNGGFLQFVHNSKWDKNFVADVRRGLAAIGATEHLAVFDGAAQIIDEAYKRDDGKLDAARFRASLDELEREHLSDSKLSQRLDMDVDDSWTWEERWQIAQVMNAVYIGTWENVRRLPLADYKQALDRIVAGIPDLKERRKEYEAARPWEKRTIDRFVAQIDLDYVWYTTFTEREYNDRKVWCWNFVVGRTIGEGHYQAIFVDGEAIIFKGDTDEVVARLPAPESASGSGVARNEPEGQPGARHPNLALLIANP
jgi:Domain of unknown function (DUF4375)